MNTPRLIPFNDDNTEVYRLLKQWVESIPVGAKMEFGVKSRWSKVDVCMYRHNIGEYCARLIDRKRKTKRVMGWVHIYTHVERIQMEDDWIIMEEIEEFKSMPILGACWLVARTKEPIENATTNLEKLCYLWSKVGKLIPDRTDTPTEYDVQLAKLLVESNKTINCITPEGSDAAQELINDRLMNYNLTLDYLINRFIESKGKTP